ncbi:unnamed protein product, partial [Prorocentrum cordatum]
SRSGSGPQGAPSRVPLRRKSRRGRERACLSHAPLGPARREDPRRGHSREMPARQREAERPGPAQTARLPRLRQQAVKPNFNRRAQEIIAAHMYEDIVDEIRNMDIIGLIGTQQRATGTAKAKWERTIDCMIKWLYGIMGAQGARWSPVILTDLNAQFSEVEGVTGEHHLGTFTRTSELMSAMLAAHQMRAINTYYRQAGPTYYNKGVAKTLDYICIPQEWHKSTMWCRTLIRSAWKLQLHNLSGLWDHVPLAACFDLRIIAEPYSPTPQVTIDKETVARMLQLGHRRAEFVGRVEQYLRSRRNDLSSKGLEERPDYANEVIHEAISSAAKVCCSESFGYTENHKAHAREVRQLLRQRREVREQFAYLSRYVGWTQEYLQEIPGQIVNGGILLSELNMNSDLVTVEEWIQMASSFLGSERYRELVAMGLEVSQIQRIIDSTILMQRLKILSKWLTKQKQQYWREVTALRCDEFMRAVKANDFHQVHKMARYHVSSVEGKIVAIFTFMELECRVIEAAPIPKGNEKEGVDGERVVMVICTLAKFHYRHMLKKALMDDIPSWAYGALRARRREGAVVVQACGAWRMQKMRVQHARRMHDATNAFFSIKTGRLNQIVLQHLDERHITMMLDRIRWAHFVFEGPPHMLVMHEGCMPGDPIMVFLFVMAYARGLESYAQDEINHVEVISPWTGKREQAALTLFVDDVADMFKFENRQAAAREGRVQNGAVTQMLGEMGLEQNVSKQETVPYCCGVGAHRLEREILQDTVLEGHAAATARYLGVRLTARFAISVEIGYRFIAAKAAWGSMGNFWTSNVSQKWKVSIYKGYVINAMMTGVETFVKKDGPMKVSDFQSMESFIARRGRVIFGGVSDTRQDGTVRSLTNLEVMVKLGSASLFVEARRLKLYDNTYLRRTWRHTSETTRLSWALMSWLLPSTAEPAPNVPPKKHKSQDSEDVLVRKMVVQLEARMRAVEYGNAVQIHMPAESVMVKNGQQKYQEYLKVTKEEGPKHHRGPPELQLFSAALKDIENWLQAEDSPQLQRFKGVPARLMLMLQHGNENDAGEWIKDFTYSPMYDTKKIRLTMCLRGSVVVCSTKEADDEYTQQQKAAWGGAPTDPAYEANLQRTPLELVRLGDKQKTVELMHLMGILLRAMGGVKKAGKVPRGEMPKQLLGKKKE